MNAKHDLLVMEDSDRVGPFWRVVGPLRGTRAEAEADLVELGTALARPMAGVTVSTSAPSPATPTSPGPGPAKEGP
jgi:hypothetical protein